jgi:hypothetical protein
MGKGVLIAICFKLPYSDKVVSILASCLENGYVNSHDNHVRGSVTLRKFPI